MKFTKIKIVSFGLCLAGTLVAAPIQIPVSVDFSQFGGAGVLTISAASLPAESFFGKNLMIPVEVVSSASVISTQNLRIDILYQLLDVHGQSLSLPTSVPIQFSKHPIKKNTLVGTALIPRSELQPIRNGGRLDYIFVARQSGRGTMLNSLGNAPAPSGSSLVDPFKTNIVSQWCSAVGPSGAKVSAPDLSLVDGRTAVLLGPGAVPTPGTLCITAEDPDTWPLGPEGTKAAAIYSIVLNDTSLQQPVQLVLSYPADVDGKVTDLNVNGESLAIHWLKPESRALAERGWRPLSRSSVDTTLHTVTGSTGHFSTFAIFPTGPVGSAQLRALERIITPNGDGVNDTASFATDVPEVRFFDIRGRRVRTVRGPGPTWDGRDDSGDIVESGVYIYQYTVQGDTISGVIAVAK